MDRWAQNITILTHLTAQGTQTEGTHIGSQPLQPQMKQTVSKEETQTKALIYTTVVTAAGKADIQPLLHCSTQWQQSAFNRLRSSPQFAMQLSILNKWC